MPSESRRWSRHVGVRAGGLYGWHDTEPASKRHAALKRGVDKDGAAEIVRRLNFLANVANRDNNERLHEVARADMHWVQSHYEEE